MTNPASDRNLLFGMLALINDFITRDQLINGMHAWMLDKNTPLGVFLEEQKALTRDQHQLLEGLVNARLQQHAGDAHKSLAAISSVGSEVREELKSIADPDLLLSLAGVSASRRDKLTDLEATQPPATVGLPTSAGSRFRILRPHAKGGLGQVSVALDAELQREVALKEIQDKHADNAEARARFLMEGEITGKLEHPGIVPVYGLGQYADGRPFYAMRFIKGDSLKDAIERFHKADEKPRSESDRTLELRKLLGRFLDVCNAIAYAHSRGVLHRDLKPGNIMLGHYGETLVVDWGLAKTRGQAEPTSTQGESLIKVSSGSGSSATEMGSALGTPAYMSPEQAAGRLDQLGPVSDVYSLGATLYCLLTGKAPIEGEPDVGRILERVQKGDFPQPRAVNAKVPPALEAVCLKAMSLRPEDRYAKVRALAEDVERWLADDPVTAWPEPWRVKARRWAGQRMPLVTGAAATVAATAVSLGIALLVLSDSFKAEKEAKKAALTSGAEAIELKHLAEKRAKDVQDTLEQLELANQKTIDHSVQLAVTTGLAADDAWDAGRVERANQLLLDIPPEFRAWEWNYRKRRFQGGHCTLFGHTAKVTSVAISPDGKCLASASEDGTVKLWDAHTKRELATLRCQESTKGVFNVAFSPDGNQLAAACFDTVKVWDMNSRRELNLLRGHTAKIHSLAFSHDGLRLATASEDKTVKLWEARTGKELFTFSGHNGIVYGVAFKPDGNCLASASIDGTVKLFHAVTGMELANYGGLGDKVRSVTFSPDGERIATCSADGMVTLWHTPSGKRLMTFRGHSQSAQSLAFSPCGSRLATASADGTAKLWDAATGVEILTLRGHAGTVEGVAFNPEGRWLATASDDGTVKLWEASEGQDHVALRGHSGSVECVTFSPDGRMLASASYDKTVKLWDAFTGMNVRTLRGHASWVTSVAFSPDMKLLASTSFDKTAKIWDVQSGRDLVTLRGHSDFLTNVVFSHSGKQLATSSGDGTVKIWDVQTGQIQHTLQGHADLVFAVAYGVNGQRLATAGGDGTVRLWDAQTGQPLLTIRGHGGAVRSVAFSRDGLWLASASADGTVKIWDATTGLSGITVRGHTDIAVSVAFSPDGNQFASASADGTVRLCNVRTGQVLITLHRNTSAVYCVAFSPDGRHLASACSDHVISLWDGQDFQELRSLRGHVKSVAKVAFSSDGRNVHGWDLDGKLLSWDWQTGKLQPGGDKKPRIQGSAIAQHPSSPVLARAVRNRIELIDIRPLDTNESGFRAWRARFDASWHETQAINRTKEKNRYAAAFHLAQLAEHQPGQVDNWNNLDSACSKLGDWSLALTACDRVLARDPAMVALYFHRAHLRANYGQFHEATVDNLFGLALAACQAKK